jgi:UDP-glucose 4-epimerase
VLEAARAAGVERMIFASSVAAYGARPPAAPGPEPSAPEVLTEDQQGIPAEPYGSAKLWAESMGEYERLQYGLDVISLRFGSIFGLGREVRGSYASGMVPVAKNHYMARVEAAVRGEPITMPRDDQVVDWTYAGDASAVAWLALTTKEPKHRLYNVPTERRRVGDYTNKLRELLPDAAIEINAEELPGKGHRFLDSSRFVAEFAFAPRYTLETGLEDYVERTRDYLRRTASAAG